MRRAYGATCTRFAALTGGGLLLGLIAVTPDLAVTRASGAELSTLQAGRSSASAEPKTMQSNRLVGRLSRASGEGSEEVRPTCDQDCQFFDIHGNPHSSPPPPAIATPIGATYSVHHLVGADLDGNNTTECFFITGDPPGALDDTVLFDGHPEEIRTDVLGTIPTVVETATDNRDGTHLLVIDTSSPPGTDLFPSGITAPGDGSPLVDSCFFIGIDERLTWAGMDAVLDASISYWRDDQLVNGPLDVTSNPNFTPPWSGFFGIAHDGAAGLGINGVHLEILIEENPPLTVAGCCVEGSCVGDTELENCQRVGGVWHFGTSCGANPLLPSPFCDHPVCGFTNGLPLDDSGVPASQFAPDEPFAVGAVDDFVLTNPDGDSCHITHVRAWTTHSPGGGEAIDPNVDYQGVNLTIYADVDPKGPGGEPVDDGGHVANVSGGVVFTQRVPMSEVTAVAQGALCSSTIWQLDIPVDLVLNDSTKYWIEIQPIMDGSRGEAYVVLSENSNGHPAQQIYQDLIPDWEAILGNADSCPDGVPATPPEGTRKNLAFQLLGEDFGSPINDNCPDAQVVSDGLIPFSTVGSTTDGPDEPDDCTFFVYSQIGSDIWFHYVANCTGELTVSLCDSSYDTKLAVYSDCGSCPPRRGSLAGCSEDAACGLQSEVTLAASEGTCYSIRVGGWVGLQGKGILSLDCVPPPPDLGACCSGLECIGTTLEDDCLTAGGTWFDGANCSTFACPIPPPPNDLCANAIDMETGDTYAGSTGGAAGTDITSCTEFDTLDVWHSWTADCTGTAKISLCGSSFDTSLAVFDSCGGTELACSDNDCGLRSKIAAPTHHMAVIAGETYYIRVSGRAGRVGDYELVVDPCTNACCFPNGFCALGTPDECAGVNGTLHEPGSFCIGDEDDNGIDDLCELEPTVWTWLDYNADYADGYLPDFDQRNDFDNADSDQDPATGIDPSYGGPMVVADALWWLDNLVPGVGVVPPGSSVYELGEELATFMGTNGTEAHPSPGGHFGPYVGTFLDDLETGVDDYLDARNLTGALYTRTIAPPLFELASNGVMDGQTVVLLLGFYHIEAVDPIPVEPTGYVVQWKRTGGHYVSVAGTDPPRRRLAISDPDADRAEEGAGGQVRGANHSHGGVFLDPEYDHTRHSDETLASHDLLEALPSFSPGGPWAMGVAGNPLIYGNLMAQFHEEDAGGTYETSTFVLADFIDENGYAIPEVCQTYTTVEAAFFISLYQSRLVEANPGHGQTLWRSRNNLARFTFSDDIDLSIADGLTIRKLLYGGGFGADRSSGFSFTVENDTEGFPVILRISENGPILTPGQWYEFRHPGSEPTIAPFAVHYLVQVGDASNDGRTLAFDVSVINSGLPRTGVADDDRRDMDGDGQIQEADLITAENHLPSFVVPKPFGH